MLIEIHMLKNYPPTNLNRDDSGMPKTCLFGGVQRGRISSQCLKRSWRKSELFENEIGKENLGIRTRQLPLLIGEKLREKGVVEDFIGVASKKLSGIGNKEGKENAKGTFTTQIAFYSQKDLEAITDVVYGFITKAKDIKGFEKINPKEFEEKLTGFRPVTLDIALFGRMITSNAFADINASMQVAHAISTNRVTMESDFFTAMDDMISGKKQDELGAAMMDDVDYDSCCYYTYASLDTDALKNNMELVENREELIKVTIPAILNTMALSNPSGKQNTFAGHSFPSSVLVECKSKKVPLSYANAFVKPAKAFGNVDLVEDSIDKLLKEVDCMCADYNLPVDGRFWFCSSKYNRAMDGEIAVNCKSFQSLVEHVSTLVG
jgi:CRISPR system Cascade subunit CasC